MKISDFRYRHFADISASSRAALPSGAPPWAFDQEVFEN
jgi:hypothetical protein